MRGSMLRRFLVAVNLFSFTAWGWEGVFPLSSVCVAGWRSVSLLGDDKPTLFFTVIFL